MTRELESTPIMKNRPLRGPFGSGWRAIYRGLATEGPGKPLGGQLPHLTIAIAKHCRILLIGQCFDYFRRETFH